MFGLNNKQIRRLKKLLLQYYIKKNQSGHINRSAFTAPINCLFFFFYRYIRSIAIFSLKWPTEQKIAARILLPFCNSIFRAHSIMLHLS